MRLSLTTKLVAALFGMSAVMVALVVVWAGWALSERFSAYVGDATLAGMDRTVATLERAYQAHGDWSGVAGHPEVWDAALRASQPPGPPPPGGPFGGAPPRGPFAGAPPGGSLAGLPPRGSLAGVPPLGSLAGVPPRGPLAGAPPGGGPGDWLHQGPLGPEAPPLGGADSLPRQGATTPGAPPGGRPGDWPHQGRPGPDVPPGGGPGNSLYQGPLGPPPDFRPEPPFGPPPGFARRGPHGALTLVDAAGTLVAGDPLEPDSAARRALVVLGRPVGALLFASGRLPGDIEAAFLAEIARDFYFAGAVALVLSGLWAVLLARYVLTPVSLVAAGARLLAGGALSTRIDTGRRDELGDLVRDFNTLAVSLEAAEQARRLWVADTSHELRTPLAVLRAQIEALQDGVHQAGTQSLGRLHDEVLRMTRLVDDLHELARADSHALGLRLEAVSPGEIMGEVVSRFAPRCQASGLQLDATALDPSGAVAMADPDRLRQVFANLVENAIRYTDTGGTILVSESRTTAEIVLKVEDTAPGVPESKLPRLFERFFRVDSSRSRQTGGSGLGLAICRAIVEAHAGTISAAPSPLGGLAVTVCLPVAAGARA